MGFPIHHNVGIRSSRRLDLYPIYIDTFAADGRAAPTEIPTIPIWEYMHAIYGVGPLQFQVSFVGRDGQAGLANFWQNALRNRWGQTHPCLKNKTVDTAFGFGTWSGGEVEENGTEHEQCQLDSLCSPTEDASVKLHGEAC